MSVHVVGNMSHRLLSLDQSFSVTSSAHQRDCAAELNQANICLFYLEPRSPDRLLDVRQIKAEHPSLSVIVIADADNGGAARMAMRCKARDFVVLPDEHQYLNQLLAMISGQIEQRAIPSGTQNSREVDFPPNQPDAQLQPLTPAIANRKRTTAAVEYIANHYTSDIEIPQLARLCATSLSVFTGAFRDEQGCTASAYITQYRMEKAMNLLRTTNLMVKEIAFQVGYPDESYFIRVFKNFAGVTPSTYRMQILKG